MLAVMTEKKVLRLEITMDDAFLMNSFHCTSYLAKEESDGVLAQCSLDV